MYYIAYGSNCNLKQMAYRCPEGKVVGTGYIEDYELFFNTHLSIKKKKGSRVPVVIWDITSDTDWKNLDRYAGYPIYYTKEIIKVGNIKGVVYIMTDYYEGNYPPTSTYFETCLTGYEENGLDTDYLFEALRRCNY